MTSSCKGVFFHNISISSLMWFFSKILFGKCIEIPGNLNTKDMPSFKFRQAKPNREIKFADRLATGVGVWQGGGENEITMFLGAWYTLMNSSQSQCNVYIYLLKRLLPTSKLITTREYYTLFSTIKLSKAVFEVL